MNWQSFNTNREGWYFDENYLQYRETDVTDASSWHFQSLYDFGGLMDAFEKRGFEVTHNGEDCNDGLLIMERKVPTFTTIHEHEEALSDLPF